MDAKSEVTFDYGEIGKLDAAAMTALHKTAEALHTEVVQATVVPRDTGHLQNEAFFVDDSDIENGSVSLVHNTPYARRLYFHPEFNFNREHNPEAQGEWFKKWLDGGSEAEFARIAYQKFYEMETGGQQ